MEQRTVADDLAEEVRNACLGMRVSRLHRVVARVYEQELQTAGLSLPQMEILTVLVTAAGPVRQAALAAKLRAERSTVSRNLALMQKRGWVTVAETSPTGRAMSVTNHRGEATRPRCGLGARPVARPPSGSRRRKRLRQLSDHLAVHKQGK
jgi:hypothetical protein